mgnify:CR=1 FL=1
MEKYIHRKNGSQLHNNDINNNIELYYFTNANRKLEIKRNIDYSFIEGDLRLQSIIQNPNKIKVYTEDEENRWFFRHLTDDYLKYLDILNVSMGCQSLLGLFESDPTYFGNSLIVLDGDVKDSAYSEAQQILKSKMNNIVKLPGNVRPEEVFYNYIINLDAEWNNCLTQKPVPELTREPVSFLEKII